MFWSQIFEMENFMDLHVLRSSKSDYRIFSGWSGGEVAGMSVIRITQKQTIPKTPNLAFYIYVQSKCFLKLLMNIGLII